MRRWSPGRWARSAWPAAMPSKCWITRPCESGPDVSRGRLSLDQRLDRQCVWGGYSGRGIRSHSSLQGKLEASTSEKYQLFDVDPDMGRRGAPVKVRANADVPDQASIARGFGAEGIGLCRTEHMFFAEDRIPIMQKMILGAEARRAGKVSRSIAAAAKAGFHRPLSGDEGLSGHHSTARSAVARIPAEA